MPRRRQLQSFSPPRCPFLLLLLCTLHLLSRLSTTVAFVIVASKALPRGNSFMTSSTPTSTSTAPNTCMSMSATATGGGATTTTDKDLLVVGMGTLGTYLGQVWKEAHGPAVAVVGETSSETRHAELKKMGVAPTVRSDRAATLQQRGDKKFPHVVFCVPPSKNEDYVAEVQGALDLWSREGGFVFTSSGGVFAEDDGGKVDESSTVTSNPRMSKILDAEQAVIKAGGLVIRLAGLYTQTRGPHTFWLARGEVGAPQDGIINLLHYEDAARAAMAGLLKTSPTTQPRTLLISDDSPLTRKQICEAAVASPFFKGQYQMPVFKVTPDAPVSMGKVYDTTRSREALGGWMPKYSSFGQFMASLQPATNNAAGGVSSR